MTYQDWPLRIMNGRTGQPYSSNANPKLLLHTTEGTRLPDYPWPPHITYDIDNDRGWRHVDGSKGSYALRSPGGGRSPNYQGGPVFQIEIISFARDSPNKPDWWYDRLNRLVIDVCSTLSIPRTIHPRGFIGSSAYGTDGANRITWNEYKAFSGVLGHQHVPFNTHWDPGNLDERRLSFGDDMDHTHQPPRSDLPRDWADATWNEWVEASGTDPRSRTWDFYREDLSWVYSRVIAPLIRQNVTQAEQIAGLTKRVRALENQSGGDGATVAQVKALIANSRIVP